MKRSGSVDIIVHFVKSTIDSIFGVPGEYTIYESTTSKTVVVKYSGSLGSARSGLLLTQYS